MDSENNRNPDLALLIFLLGIAVLTAPVLNWWARGEHPWYLPYLIWAGLIALSALRPRRNHSDDL